MIFCCRWGTCQKNQMSEIILMLTNYNALGITVIRVKFLGYIQFFLNLHTMMCAHTSVLIQEMSND
jgi:hypothetical protein